MMTADGTLHQSEGGGLLLVHHPYAGAASVIGAGRIVRRLRARARPLTTMRAGDSVQHMSSTENVMPDGRLAIELETASLAVRLLGLGAGTQLWQFVAKADGHPVFTSATFAAPYSWGGIPTGRTISPQEEWAPGMTEALEDLKRDIERGGWIEVSRGRQPWEITYERA